jgi:hypothetical protein
VKGGSQEVLEMFLLGFSAYLMLSRSDEKWENLEISMICMFSDVLVELVWFEW